MDQTIEIKAEKNESEDDKNESEDDESNCLPLGHRNLFLNAFHYEALISATKTSNPEAMAHLLMLPNDLDPASDVRMSDLVKSEGLRVMPFPGAEEIETSLLADFARARSHRKVRVPKLNKNGVPLPKRPETAYITFTRWYMSEMRKRGEKIPKLGNFGKECGGKWNSITENEKKPFVDAANRDRERYNKEMQVYKPPRDANKPKRPGTGFMLFMRDFRKTMAGKEPEGGVSALAKLGGEQWRNMNPAEKKPYLELQEKEKDRYDIDMEAYRRSKKNLATLTFEDMHN